MVAYQLLCIQQNVSSYPIYWDRQPCDVLILLYQATTVSTVSQNAPEDHFTAFTAFWC